MDLSVDAAFFTFGLSYGWIVENRGGVKQARGIFFAFFGV
jgi:hypothetical protein